MKTSIYTLAKSFILILVLGCCASPLISQEEESKPPERPVRNMFESNWLLDNQTVIVPIEGTLEMDILHRFGTWDNGYDDFFGIYAPSNIRLGFTYVVIPNLQLGIGLTKNKNLWDFNLKYALFSQTRSGSTPLSLTYFGNMAIDTRDGDIFQKGTDRYSYFHQLMVARKLSDKLSFQVSGNISHFNAVGAFINDAGEEEAVLKNDHLSSTLAFRYKLTDITSFIASYDLPITDHAIDDPESNLSFGFEFVTSSHAFQLFIGNYNGIVPQYNQSLNKNAFGDNQILLGFNITRLWN
jgi:hypothetical protein